MKKSLYGFIQYLFLLDLRWKEDDKDRIPFSVKDLDLVPLILLVRLLLWPLNLYFYLRLKEDYNGDS
jgi:hypothetical protein